MPCAATGAGAVPLASSAGPSRLLLSPAAAHSSAPTQCVPLCADVGRPSAYFSSFNSRFPGYPNYPPNERVCCDWCRNNTECVWWEWEQRYSPSAKVRSGRPGGAAAARQPAAQACKHGCAAAACTHMCTHAQRGSCSLAPSSLHPRRPTTTRATFTTSCRTSR